MKEKELKAVLDDFAECSYLSTKLSSLYPEERKSWEGTVYERIQFVTDKLLLDIKGLKQELMLVNIQNNPSKTQVQQAEEDRKGYCIECGKKIFDSETKEGEPMKYDDFIVYLPEDVDGWKKGWYTVDGYGAYDNDEPHATKEEAKESLLKLAPWEDWE